MQTSVTKASFQFQSACGYDSYGEYYSSIIFRKNISNRYLSQFDLRLRNDLHVYIVSGGALNSTHSLTHPGRCTQGLHICIDLEHWVTTKSLSCTT